MMVNTGGPFGWSPPSRPSRLPEIVGFTDVGALAPDVDAAHARVAERVERVCVREERGVVVVRVHIRAHPCALGDARAIVERDVPHGVA